MPLTKYARKKNMMEIINSTSTGSSSPSAYLALSSTLPSLDGTNVTEPPSGVGYQRIPVRWNIMSGTSQYVANFPTEPTYDDVTDKYSITNIRDIYFYEATGSWGTLGYFAIYDGSSSSAQLLAFGTLTTAISPTADTVPVIRAGQMTIVEQ